MISRYGIETRHCSRRPDARRCGAGSLPVALSPFGCRENLLRAARFSMGNGYLRGGVPCPFPLARAKLSPSSPSFLSLGWIEMALAEPL